MLPTFIRGFLELLSPPMCAACASAIGGRGLVFCDACEPLVDRALDNAHGTDFDACVYGGPLRDAVHRLKYREQSELATGLAHWLVEAAESLAGEIDVVCAVPLHPRRLRERGYNQSVLLAKPVARSLDVPLWPGLLSRPRAAQHQVGRGRKVRAQSLQGAFVAQARAQHKRVLVIDDVRTTGATLNEARRALLTAEARAVFTLALARADDTPDELYSDP